jgi:hypothetical protein
MTDLAKQLELIELHAPLLRAAGVHSLAIGEISMVLLPPEPTALIDIGTAEPPRATLDDNETYGLPEDARVPGFDRPDDLPRQ